MESQRQGNGEVPTHRRVFLCGAWIASDGTSFGDVVNPATEEVVARVVSGTARDVEAAVAAARRAFGPWSSTKLADRLAILDRAYAVFQERTEALAKVITRELGAPIRDTRRLHAKGAGELLRLTSEMARAYPFEREEEGSLIVREPYGVVAAITPWNNPVYMQLLKVAPALAAGCTVVHKPAETTPLSAMAVAEIFREAQLPPGVYNLVLGTGAEVGSALDEHPDVDLVSFTGSTAGGREVARLAAKRPTRAVLELGGKSACLVLDDADLERAVRATVGSAFNNAGQMCGAWTRLVVPRARLSRATELAVALARAYVLGDPEDEATTMGPVANAKQRDTVIGHIEAGLAEGARLACGGPKRPKHLSRGYFVEPTVFTEVDNRMRVAQEEIFGPVLCILGHDGDDDAVSIANDSVYGLRGAVFSGDPARALAVAKRVRTGQVDINGYKMRPTTAFGGYKQSGYGRCQGRIGFEEYLQIKSIQL